MSAIAGICGLEFGSQDDAMRSMMASLAGLGASGSRFKKLGDCLSGAQFHHTLPEDDLDRQPYVFGSGRYLLVADARIDNREELGIDLGLPPQSRAVSDAELLALGWERWRLGITERLLGDYALAVWDDVEREMTLVRGPLSSRPLFYTCRKNSVALASLPSAIVASGIVAAEPNLDEFARLLGGGLYLNKGDSFFSAIRSVRQGTAVVVKDGRALERQLWLPGQDRSEMTLAEVGELLRDQLDRAVRSQTRRKSTSIAYMLSSGRDSSAVVASAARTEDANKFALTAAPGRSVEGLQPPWLGDEAAIAAETAGRAQIRHLVCRSEYQELSHLLDEVAAVDFQPFNNPANLPWIRQLCRTAKAEGAGVITGAFAGNLTISLGGPAFLADLWRENGLAAWLEAARALANRDDLSWLQIAARSFGWIVPRGGYALLRQIFGRRAALNPSLPLLRQPYRTMAENYRREGFGDPRARRSNRDHVSRLIRHIEPGNKYALACWGVDVRDPTAARRVAELCLSLPVNTYVDGKHGRPAFHQAFKDRLLDEVLEGRHVGAQAADWFATIRPHDVLAGFRRYASNPLVREMFDLAAVEVMIEGWPTSPAAADLVHDEYCNQLLGGLAVASFINAHFPG